MKKITLTTFLVVFLSVFTACDVEPIDPVVNDYVPEDSGSGEEEGEEDGGGNNGGGSSAVGDYWPFAVNNEWTYEYAGNDTENFDPMKIIGTEVINGKTYYRMNHYFQDSGTDDMTGTAKIYLRKENGAYFQRTSVDIPDENGIEITVSPYELTVLKDLEVNQTWEESVVQTTSYYFAGMTIPSFDMTINVKGTILEKGITMTVAGETYTDVIKEKFEQTINNDLLSTDPIVTVSYVWFAKNVGPIKTESVAGSLNYSMTLTSYTIN